VTRRPKKLLDQVRDATQCTHHAWRTEKAYIHRAKRSILYHDERHRSDKEISGSLTTLAGGENRTASTQNQALSALLFLCTDPPRCCAQTWISPHIGRRLLPRELAHKSYPDEVRPADPASQPDRAPQPPSRSAPRKPWLPDFRSAATRCKACVRASQPRRQKDCARRMHASTPASRLGGRVACHAHGQHRQRPAAATRVVQRVGVTEVCMPEFS